MNLPLYIARRYLFSKKSHHAINIISGISVCGVALATLAMVCTLSVFNGFQDLVASFFTAFDPELKITVRQGKVFDAQDERLAQVRRPVDLERGARLQARLLEGRRDALPRRAEADTLSTPQPFTAAIIP